MSDSKGWVGNTDRNRIRGLMARSAHVIATAREGLDKSSTDLEDLSGASEPGSAKLKSRRPKFPASKFPASKVSVSGIPISKTAVSKNPGPKFPEPKISGSHSSAKPKLPNPNPPAPEVSFRPQAKLSLEDLPPLEPIQPQEPIAPETTGRDRSALASYASIEPVDDRKTASSRRRALFRRFLKTRDIEDVRPLERFQRDGVEDAVAEEIAPDTDSNDPADGTKGWLSKLRKRRERHADARLDTKAFNTLILEDEPDRDELGRGGRDQNDHDRDDLGRGDLDRDDLDRDDLDRNDPDRGDLDQPAPWKDARFTHEPWEWRGADPEPKRPSRLSVLVRWTQRLDALTNAVAGVLIVTLLSFWTIGMGEPGSTAEPVAEEAEANAVQAPASPDPVVERAAADAAGMALPGEDPVAALIAKTRLPQIAPEKSEARLPSAGGLAAASRLPSASGFGVHAQSYPKPLPAMPADVPTMHSWARASMTSAPGLSLLPYTGLPQAIPAVPPDVEGHFRITTPQ